MRQTRNSYASLVLPVPNTNFLCIPIGSYLEYGRFSNRNKQWIFCSPGRAEIWHHKCAHFLLLWYYSLFLQFSPRFYVISTRLLGSSPGGEIPNFNSRCITPSGCIILRDITSPGGQHMCAYSDKTVYLTLNGFRSNRAHFSYVISSRFLFWIE